MFGIYVHVTVEQRKTAFRQNVVAVWHFRPEKKRHILVLPYSAKVVTAKNGKNANHLKLIAA